MNEGKKFEEDFKKSIPSWCWCYRFRDSAGTWQGGSKTRFTPSNICDFMVMADKLFLLELKSHKGSSIPINCIRENQLKQMSEIEKSNIAAYFIFNFRDKEKTYAIKAKEVKSYVEGTERKSIPISWCEENGIEILSTKKKVRYRYNLTEMFGGQQ